MYELKNQLKVGDFGCDSSGRFFYLRLSPTVSLILDGYETIIEEDDDELWEIDRAIQTGVDLVVLRNALNNLYPIAA